MVISVLYVGLTRPRNPAFLAERVAGAASYFHFNGDGHPHNTLLATKAQRALTSAYTLGYYDIPKKIGLVQLAERLDLAYSTLEAHLRKAERQLLSYMINES